VNRGKVLEPGDTLGTPAAIRGRNDDFQRSAHPFP